jgi:ketosteroid isomerase-like protein
MSMSESATAEIKAVIDERIAAIGDKDSARAIACLADDVVAFELAPPLSLGADAVRD